MYNITTYETNYVTKEFAESMAKNEKTLSELAIRSATVSEKKQAVQDLYKLVGANMLSMDADTLAVLTSSLIRVGEKRVA